MKLNTLIYTLIGSEKGCRLAQVVTLVLGLLALHVLGSLLENWWADFSLLLFKEQTTISDDKDYQATIQNAHLFGLALPTSILSYSKTRAPLKLTGLIQENRNGRDSFKAIITQNNANGKIYEEGDILPEGIKVLLINAEGILLDNKGQWERLSLQRLKWGERG